MAQPAIIRPLAFPQSSYISSKYKRHADNSDASPYPSDNESQPRSTLTKPHLKLHIHRRSYLPDEEDEEAYPSKYTRTQENWRPGPPQPPRHSRRSTNVPPVSGTTAQRRSDLQRRTSTCDHSPVREHGRTVEEQISDVRAALRRVEAERQNLLDQIEAEKVDRYKAERELAEARKENQRLTARLEELLKGSSLRTPLSARSDDGWGYSMYDHKVDGRW